MHKCPAAHSSAPLLSLALAVSFWIAAPSTARAQDSDRDGVIDSLDAYPCDPGAQATAFAPAEHDHAMLLFEDLWPRNGDLDYNDVVVTYNYAFRIDGQLRVSGLHATFNALALGGVKTQGLGWHLPVARDRVARVTRSVGGGAPEALALSPADAEATVQLSANLRELFGGATGPINSAATDARRIGANIRVDVTFTEPLALDLSGAPYDVYIFDSSDPSHELHRPQYPGTAAMDTRLFGTSDDGSSGARHFVNRHGLPFVLALPELSTYPAEGRSIADLFPKIIPFATSGGALYPDFYTSGDAHWQFSYRDANGEGRLDPEALGVISVDTSCELPTCTDGVQNGDETGVDCGGHCTVAETCNGKDDDCNGVVDEGFGTVTCGVGACRVTVAACSDGHLVECVPGTATLEACDGVDNDCDGVVDNGCTCVHGTTQSCYSGAAGTLGVGECHAGTQTCYFGAWSPCDGEVGPVAESCNGRDDDCDGTADQGLGELTCGLGACHQVVAACVNGVAETCTPGTPSAEVCNGVDDDCDGVIDDEQPMLACGVGACFNEMPSCVNGVAQACVAGTPSAEVCNGVDDDCDGVIDDGIMDGGAACNTGLRGLCGTGQLACVRQGPNWAVFECQQTVFPQPETCDNRDEDCDGVIDNGADAACAPIDGAGVACVRGACTCVPNRCSGQCGTFPDGCGGQMICGTSCVASGQTSGYLDDQCGHTLVCGTGYHPQVAAGLGATCAITADTGLMCWGQGGFSMLATGRIDDANQATRVPSFTGVREVVAGQYHMCALMNDGTVRCWGNNQNGQSGAGDTAYAHDAPTPVVGITNAVSISAGRYHTCARLADGTVQCWGLNDRGQLGDGSHTTRTAPVVVAGLTDVADLAAGSNHTCALITNGTVQCWGYGAYNQLGQANLYEALSPVVVPGISTAIQVAGSNSSNHACALLADGTVQCWGWNLYGQLGDGSGAVRTSPVAVSGLSSVVQISAAMYTSCARLADGTLRCWGTNTGDGTATQRNAPVAVPSLANVTSVTTSENVSCATLANGTVSCWGNGLNFAVGDLTSITRNSPTPVYGFPCGGGGTSVVCNAACTPTTCAAQGVSSGTIPDGCGGTLTCGATTQPMIATGQSFSCGLRSDGVVRCWGLNSSGQLGDGTTTQRTTPVSVSGVSSATSVVAGEAHACALISGGTVRCWGRNAEGQLGDGTLTQRTTSVPVTGITNAVSITAGRRHTCAVLPDGTARCWGWNSLGQLGNISSSSTGISTPQTVTTTDIATITAGYQHTCALITNGRIKCWADAAAGQLGNGNQFSYFGTWVPNMESTVSVMAGRMQDFTCGVLANGTGWCWGYNGFRELGDGTTTNRNVPTQVVGLANATQVSTGFHHACARLADGTGRCWGYNVTGALGNGNSVLQNGVVTVLGLSTIAEISAGYRHSCAMLANRTVRCWGNNVNGELGDGTTTQRNAPVAVSLF